MQNPRFVQMTRIGNARRSRPGFTLTELLVVIAIIAVLAIIVFTVSSKMIAKANAVKDASTMRQIGIWINLYASDTNGYMPGPLFTGQAAVYNVKPSGNLREWRRLSDCIAGYAGYEDPEKGQFIAPMACSWQKSDVQKNSTVYNMQSAILIGEAASAKTDNPWGRPAPASAEDRLPMRLAAVMSQPSIGRTWMMVQADKLGTPTKPAPGLREQLVHGNFRLALYFDGSITKVDRNNDKL